MEGTRKSSTRSGARWWRRTEEGSTKNPKVILPLIVFFSGWKILNLTIFTEAYIVFFMGEMMRQEKPESQDFRKWYVDQYFGFAEQLELDGMTDKVIRRAYRDMCRTLVLKKVDKVSSPTECTECYENASKGLATNINSLKDEPDYDAWHKRSCDKLKEPYQGVLTYGQAQKWVNMTLKYIYTLQWDYPLLAEPLKSKIKCFHIPIDSYVVRASIARWPKDLEAIYGELGFVWSKYTNYEKYLELQNKYREICKREELGCLLDMEFWLWIEASHQRKPI